MPSHLSLPFPQLREEDSSCYPSYKPNYPVESWIVISVSLKTKGKDAAYSYNQDGRNHARDIPFSTAHATIMLMVPLRPKLELMIGTSSFCRAYICSWSLAEVMTKA